MEDEPKRSIWIVTIKLPKNPNHDPQNKVTGKCLLSDHCTDVTGEHHSGLIFAYSEAEIRQLYGKYHITRMERI